VDVTPSGEPHECVVAVFERRREGMLGCEAIVNRGDEHAQFVGHKRAQAVVLRGVSDDISATMDPQQR
jgi:hypothetical protein